MKRLLALAATLLLSGPALAHEVKVGDLEIIHPHIPQPAATAKAAGGYMAIVNNGAEADRLIGVETDIAAKADVHESKVDADGIGTMEPVAALDLPAGETVSLDRGGYHIMFMGLKGPAMLEGEMRKVTLIFEHAGRVEVEFMIDPPMGEAMEGMDHMKMDHTKTDDASGG
ncbi:MAG: copper chaperone PCu(A)C [Rhodobacterales bacterium]|nr:copper chaperone PCu(A)C [Rhodobacterales bacterium]